MENITKQVFESGIARVCDRLDSIDKRISLIEDDVKQIQQMNYRLTERIVKVEINLDNSRAMYRQLKDENIREYQNIYEKIRSKEQEIRKNLLLEIEKQNTAQNIKIISKAVGLTLSIIGIIFGAIKIFKG